MGVDVSMMSVMGLVALAGVVVNDSLDHGRLHQPQPQGR